MTEAAIAVYDPFVAIDRLDDEAIIAELEGRTIKALVYEFLQDGQIVRGLSKGGVDAVAAKMARHGEVIRELDLTCDMVSDPGEAFFHVRAARYSVATNKTTGEIHEVLLDAVFGVKRQARSFDNGRSNPHWYEQGAMKAARNAKRRLIREDLAQEIIQLAVKEGRTRRVEPAPAPSGATPPAGVPQRKKDVPAATPRSTSTDTEPGDIRDSADSWAAWEACTLEAKELGLYVPELPPTLAVSALNQQVVGLRAAINRKKEASQ